LHCDSPDCFYWHAVINTPRRIIPVPHPAKTKAPRNEPRRLVFVLQQAISWSAGSPKFPVSAALSREGPHLGHLDRVSLPETTRPVVRSSVLSTSENRIATLA
jgi:hypothetical protein